LRALREALRQYGEYRIFIAFAGFGEWQHGQTLTISPHSNPSLQKLQDRGRDPGNGAIGVGGRSLRLQRSPKQKGAQPTR
jgi:hypothetical protein